MRDRLWNILNRLRCRMFLWHAPNRMVNAVSRMCWKLRRS